MIKRGVILPNSVQEWERANKYFRDHLHHNNKVKDVSKEINDMQNKICEYFSETHGQVKDKEINEYKNWTKNQLKSHLKLLKSQNPKPVEEIKWVSRVLLVRVQTTFWYGLWPPNWVLQKLLEMLWKSIWTAEWKN